MPPPPAPAQPAPEGPSAPANLKTGRNKPSEGPGKRGDGPRWTTEGLRWSPADETETGTEWKQRRGWGPEPGRRLKRADEDRERLGLRVFA